MLQVALRKEVLADIKIAGLKIQKEEKKQEKERGEELQQHNIENLRKCFNGPSAKCKTK